MDKPWAWRPCEHFWFYWVRWGDVRGLWVEEWHFKGITLAVFSEETKGEQGESYGSVPEARQWGPGRVATLGAVTGDRAQTLLHLFWRQSRWGVWIGQMWTIKGRVKGFGRRWGRFREEQIWEERAEGHFWLFKFKETIRNPNRSLRNILVKGFCRFALTWARGGDEYNSCLLSRDLNVQINFFLYIKWI